MLWSIGTLQRRYAATQVVILFTVAWWLTYIVMFGLDTERAMPRAFYAPEHANCAVA